MKKDLILAPSYRTLWISDTHLGTKSSRAIDLLNFLSEVNADRIYLVGDIVDLQRMKVSPIFPKAHLSVIAKLVGLAHQGTEVIYIPGNHDHEFRATVGREICGIPVMFEVSHEMPSGQNCWLRTATCSTDRFERAPTSRNSARRPTRCCWRWTSCTTVCTPVCTSIKRRLKSADEYFERFETVAAQYALDRGFDGIVCGHIHRPGIRRIGDCLYANDGDWVEHRTALSESPDGSLQLLNWQQDTIQVESLDSALAPAA